MYVIYTPVLRAVLPCTYVQDVLYAGFTGRLNGCNRLITSGISYLAKTGHEKIQINRNTLRIIAALLSLFYFVDIFFPVKVLICNHQKFGIKQGFFCVVTNRFKVHVDNTASGLFNNTLCGSGIPFRR